MVQQPLKVVTEARTTLGMLSTNIGLNRLVFSESTKSHIRAVGYRQVGDFVKNSCFDLFGPFLEHFSKLPEP